MRMWGAFLLLVPLGCSQSVSSGPLPATDTARTTDGSRLRGLSWVPEDGTPVTVPGLFDDAELARCRHTTLTEGDVARCLPGGFGYPTLANGPVFEDATCETMALPVYACGPAPGTFVADAPRFEGGQATLLRAFRVTARPVDVERPLFQTNAFTEGSCVAIRDENRIFEPAFFAFDHVAAERVPEAELAGVDELVREDLGGGLAEVTRRWSDGTVERFREPLGEPCTVRRAADGRMRCFPAAARWLEGFGDPECTEPVWAETADSRLRLGRAMRLDDSGVVLDVREAVGEPGRRELYRRSGERCVLSGERDAVALSAPIPLSRFPALRREAVGRGRLQPMTLLDDEGRAWRAEARDRYAWNDALTADRLGSVSFWDAELELECVGSPTPSGVRCLPRTSLRTDASAPPSGWFRDDRCEVPVLGIAGTDLDEVTHVAVVGSFGETCDAGGGVTELRRAGPALPATTPVHRRVDPERCEAEGVAGDFPRMRFYALDGEAEDLTRFARFRRSPLAQVR